MAAGGTLPILGNVAIHASGSCLALTCTDLDLTVQTKTKAAIQKPGETTVNASLFFNIVNSLTGDGIEVLHEKDTLSINCGQSKYKLGTLEYEGFPPFPKVERAVEFDLPQVVLRNLLAETLFAQSVDESRFVLNSTLLSLCGAHVISVCTDGRRIAVEEADVALKGKTEAQLLLPLKTVTELLRHLAGEEKSAEEAGPVHVSLMENSAQFTVGDVIICSKLIDGTYPNYKQVVPDCEGKGLPVSRTDLLGALKRVNIVASTGPSPSCVLEFEGQMLTVMGTGAKSGHCEALETLLIPKAKTMRVAFNPQYLIEALDAVADDEVLIYLTDATCPITIKVASKPWLCVIMPLRLGMAQRQRRGSAPTATRRCSAARRRGCTSPGRPSRSAPRPAAWTTAR